MAQPAAQMMDQGTAPAWTPLCDQSVFALAVSLIADEISAKRKRAVPLMQSQGWTRDTPVDEDGVGLDSLDRLDVAIRLNQFFHLHQVGLEDYLLLEPTLGGWCDLIMRSLAIRNEHLTFQTSGSSGAPKTCAHSVADLQLEADALAGLFPGVRRILSFVPPHHIFGFLTTVLLPEKLDVPCVDARGWGPSSWQTKLRPGDLLVATPYHWDALSKVVEQYPSGVYGVTSTAPMGEALKERIVAAGVTQLTELYGSSETAGIGWRRNQDRQFRLFDHLQRQGDGVVKVGEADPRALPIQDRLDWSSATTFLPAGRLDGAVQIGGVNVFPLRIEAALCGYEAVKDAIVRVQTDRQDGAARLEAFIVPMADNVDEPALEACLHAFCASNLRAVERPVNFTIGRAIPLNAMGKRCAW